MPLNAGDRVGSYEVTAKIGEGGMREVYRARDTKLDRDDQDDYITEPSTKPGKFCSHAPATMETCNGRQGWSEG